MIIKFNVIEKKHEKKTLVRNNTLIMTNVNRFFQSGQSKSDIDNIQDQFLIYDANREHILMTTDYKFTTAFCSNFIIHFFMDILGMIV